MRRRATRAHDDRALRVQTVPEVLVRMEELLADHNATSKRPMNLALFLYALEHVSRACRVLRQPGAHLLNIGVGGSGRASLSRLAAFVEGATVCQVEITKGYTAVEWRDDLKRFTRMCAPCLAVPVRAPVVLPAWRRALAVYSSRCRA